MPPRSQKPTKTSKLEDNQKVLKEFLARNLKKIKDILDFSYFNKVF